MPAENLLLIIVGLGSAVLASGAVVVWRLCRRTPAHVPGEYSSEDVAQAHAILQELESSPVRKSAKRWSINEVLNLAGMQSDSADSGCTDEMRGLVEPGERHRITSGAELDNLQRFIASEQRLQRELSMDKTGVTTPLKTASETRRETLQFYGATQMG